jgi:hypothetical protein
MVWSYSRITSFEDCPYKWFLTYLYRDEHGKSIKKKSGFFAEYGSYMHLILQMYLSGILPRKDLSTFYVAHFNDNVHAKAPNPKIYHNYFEQGFHYFDKISFPQRNILGVEQHVDFTFAGKPFTGFIDVVSDDGHLIITDHKSRALKPRSKRSKPTKADAELDDYLRQLYVYSAAVKNEYGRFPDLLEFNCFRSQTMIQEPFNPERFYLVEDWAKSEINRITCNDSWKANPDYWRCNNLCDVCHECEYRGLV